jgi:PqqD family protein of HPr-rel-A system
LQRLEATAGTLLQPVAEGWAAFSALSGETHLLNVEAAALLEALIEAPLTLAEVAELLAADTGVAVSSIAPLLHDAALEFQAAGLVRPLPGG